MNTLPKLYKISSSGKIQEWSIRCFMRGDIGIYEITHGQLNGKMQVTETEVKQGKNIGRSNQTSVWEQTQSEAESKWNKQVDRKGYSVDIPDKRRFRPMLAKSFNKPGQDVMNLKDGKHIKFPCYYQPKLDGVRCTVHNGIMSSRQGKYFTSMPHIEKVLGDIPSNIVLDGELYIHGEEFQELVGAIKRDDPSAESLKIQYHVYDLYDMEYPDSTFAKRQILMEKFVTECDIIKPVETTKLEDKFDVHNTITRYMKLGYEGIMLRNILGKYKVDGRSADLQKVKVFMEEEFKIVGAEPNKGKMKNQCTFFCEHNGVEFGVKPEGTEEIREKYWADWQDGIIKPGDLLTVMFFSWTTSDNPVPRFPVGKCIRDYDG